MNQNSVTTTHIHLVHGHRSSAVAIHTCHFLLTPNRTNQAETMQSLNPESNNPVGIKLTVKHTKIGNRISLA